MSQNKWFRRVAGAALACASVVSIAPLGGSAVPVVSAQASDPGGEFHTLEPARILDTRSNATPQGSINDVAPLGAKRQAADAIGTSQGEFTFNPLGLGGLPEDPNDVLAIVANFTVTGAQSGGFLAVYPKGFEFGGTDGSGDISAIVNFAAGDSVPNLAFVGLDDNGDMTINAAGLAGSKYHLVIDVFGFISTSQYDGDSVGGRLQVVDPGRLMDTRKTGGPIAPGETRELQILGADTILDDKNSPIRQDIVPNDNDITAVMVNLALVNTNPGSAGTFLTATPTKINRNDTITANSNVSAGGIKANMTIVPVGSDGKIRLYNENGNLDVVVDVLGYFEQGVYTNADTGRIVPLEAPFRAFDTREDDFGDAPLQHGSKEEWSFENFARSVVLNPDSGDDAIKAPAQQALIGSLVATNLQPLYPSHAGGNYSSFLRLAPANGAQADTANVNFFLGQDVGNMSLVKYGTSGSDNHVVEAYNAYGSVDYVLDVYAIVLS